MLGLIDGGIEVDENGNRRLQEKTWDMVGNDYVKKTKNLKTKFFELEADGPSDDDDFRAFTEIVRLKKKPTAFKRRKKLFDDDPSKPA